MLGHHLLIHYKLRDVKGHIDQINSINFEANATRSGSSIRVKNTKKSDYHLSSSGSQSGGPRTGTGTRSSCHRSAELFLKRMLTYKKITKINKFKSNS